MNFTTTHSPDENLSELNTEINTEYPSIILNTLRTKNNETIIIGNLSINHIENKFQPFVSLLKDKLDIVLLSETKIDNSFPSSQFVIQGYSNLLGETEMYITG